MTGSAIAAMLSIASIILLAGCGSDGGFADAIDAQLADYRVVDLTDGSSTWLAEAPAIGDPALTDRYLVLRRMPAHQARLGAAEDDPDADTDERTRSTITVGPCFVAIVECTAAQWGRLNRLETSGDGNLPQVDASRDQILSAVQAYALRSGLRFDLPTASEWEAAARWGHGGQFPFAADEPQARAAQAMVLESVPSQRAQPVAGVRRTDPLGLYDMHGNVWELVRDLDGQGNATACGGSWNDPVVAARASNRLAVPPEAGHPLIGFRLVLRP